MNATVFTHHWCLLVPLMVSLCLLSFLHDNREVLTMCVAGLRLCLFVLVVAAVVSMQTGIIIEIIRVSPGGPGRRLITTPPASPPPPPVPNGHRHQCVALDAFH